MPAAALSYHEPGIVTILIQASFLILLNVINWLLDNAIYCGLLGQVFVGIVWGAPGANWLSSAVQDMVMQLGYLGLILIVYEGGLSTSFDALMSNLHLSATVALIGVSVPIGLSFVLQGLVNATPVQAFAAGAALCSTSLGTTFTILSTSGLEKSRLGVILSSAAMLDDVAGLVMVQVISNLGTSAGSFSATTVVRPVFVSVAFAVIVPLVCRFVVQPLTKYSLRNTSNETVVSRWLCTPAAAFVAHTVLIGSLVTGSTYAGTSNLFAAYIAGTVVSWWDVLVLDLRKDDHTSKPTKIHARSSDEKRNLLSANDSALIARSNENVAETHLHQHPPGTAQSGGEPNGHSGTAIYERFYAPAVTSILKPFFFASIGFAIPITQMFQGAILWRGMVYTVLMVIGKLVCGLVLVRIADLPDIKVLPRFLRSKKKTTERHEAPAQTAPSESPPEQSSTDTFVTINQNTQSPEQPQISPPNTSYKAAPSKIPKPQSLNPAAILGSAMVARGEIGFLISSLAESTGVFGAQRSQPSSGDSSSSSGSDTFLIVTWAILLCTIIGPVSVGVIVKRVRRLQMKGRERGEKTGRMDPLGIWGVI